MTIERTTKTFSRTASGKGWKSKPDTTDTDIISSKIYDNISSRESLRFWNGFCGGTCRAEYGYTYYGYVPIRISRQNPSRDVKIVETFRFKA